MTARTAIAFHSATPVGALTIEPVDPDRDAALVQRWLDHPASSFWQMADLSVEEVRTTFAASSPTRTRTRGSARATVSPCSSSRRTTRPASSSTDVHDCRAGRPRHAPARRAADRRARPRAHLRRHGERRAIPVRVARRPADRRRTRHPQRAHRAQERRGRVPGAARGRVLPGKRASLGPCVDARRLSRRPSADGGSATACRATDRGGCRSAPAPDTMARAQRHLVAKAIAEFTHERLLAPVADGDRFRVDTRESSYRFAARRHVLEHWAIDEASSSARSTAPGRRARRAGPRDRAAGRARHPRRAARGLPRGDSPRPWRAPRSSSTAAACRPTSSPRRLPGDRSGHDRGSPGVRREQRPHRLRARRVRRLRTGVRGIRAPRLARRAARRSATSRCVPGSTSTEHYAAELGAETLARFAERLGVAGTRPGRVPLPAGASVAVAAPHRDHLRARRGAQRPRAPRRRRRRATARSSRSARSSTARAPNAPT